jgi:hypothetical protein
MTDYLRDEPEGAYRSDKFFERFTPKALADSWAQLTSEEKSAPWEQNDGQAQLTPKEELAFWRKSHFEVFRFDVERVVKVAYIRARRENEVEPARRQANELLEILAQFPPELKRLEQFPANVFRQVGKVLQPKSGELPLVSPETVLLQVLDCLRAPLFMSYRGPEGLDSNPFPLTGKQRIEAGAWLAAARGDAERLDAPMRGRPSYLLQWLDELSHYEIRPPLGGSRRVPLQRHLVEQTIALHERRLGRPPPGTRRYWLGQFTAALWTDLEEARPPRALDLEDYFGKKIEDTIRGA